MPFNFIPRSRHLYKYLKDILLLLTFVLSLGSCYFFQENGIEVVIENNSDNAVSNIMFSTTENLSPIQYKSLETGETRTDFFKMKDHRTDGSYVLTFTRSHGKMEKIGAGYYTNGISLDRRMLFIIENDTVITRTSQDQ